MNSGNANYAGDPRHCGPPIAGIDRGPIQSFGQIGGAAPAARDLRDLRLDPENQKRAIEAANQAANQCANKTSPEAEIPSLISQIENQGAYLHERLSFLEKRLDSVLRPPYPSDPECAQCDGPSTSTGGRLLSINNALAAAIARLDYLSNRLAV